MNDFLKARQTAKEIVSLYFKDKNGKPYLLTDGEAEIFLSATNPNYKWDWYSAPTRYGKLIANSIPVLTTKGWKNHGELVVGDYVFNHLGKSVKVIGIAPKDRADIKITFSNGEEIITNNDHKWLVQHRRWNDWRVVETKWLANRTLKWSDGKKAFKLPKIKPLKFEKRKLPVDPYTLGAWLGDGTTTAPRITIHPDDFDIIKNIPYKVSAKNIHNKTGIASFNFWKTDIVKGLKEIGVVTRYGGGGFKGEGNKFIPDIYKFSSVKQRTQLLAGLIDTDGYVRKEYRNNGDREGRVIITNTNKRLIDDCVEIVRSLSMRVSITKVKASLSTSGIQGKKDIYYLGFDAELSIPTVLERKKVYYRKKNKFICIDRIEKIKPAQGNCIKVDSDDGIYLVGKKLIPTHNSETLALALIYCAVFFHVKIPVVAGTEDKAKKIMEYIVQHLSDNTALYSGLINLDITNIDRLKIQMAKDALRWKDGGWIYITSVESANMIKEGQGVIGEGGDIVVLEEAGLIKHKEQLSKIIRMPESGRGWGKLIMSGNCIEKSVFEDAYNNPLYHKVRISLKQAIEEGRFTRKELDEKKSQTTSKDWKRFYKVRFPKANEFTYFKPQKYEILPDEMKYYGALDPALGEAKKGSRVGIVVLGLDKKNQAYEAFSAGLRIKPEEAIRTIFNLPYKFERFVVESVQFQKYFLSVIEEKNKLEKKYIPFTGIQQARNKEQRIESMEPHINTGHILFKGDGYLWDEMQDYPDSENKDTLDALEMCWRTIGLGQFEFSIV